MNISIDLAAIIVQCGVLLFFLGKFSEKISSLEKSNNAVLAKLDSLGASYLTVKDGTRIDFKLDAAWVAIDHLKEQILTTIETHSKNCKELK